ncbi:MAG TPA: SMP-30/gluconolactonase/LRE family protein, partial [Usitatibacter sp.]|nr:SMP-30/gluconolactonase/LRE family protein [Usitatibacter sp.]
MKKPLVIAFLLLAAFAAQAQQTGDAAQRGMEAVQRLLRERPADPTLWFYLARYQAQEGAVADVVQSLAKVGELGEGFLPPRDGFERVWTDPRFIEARAKLESKLPRLDFAPTAFQLEEALLIPEGLAYDEPSHTFFVGSIAQHRILRVDEASQAVHEFAGAEAHMDAVLGLAMDSPRRLLYAVSTSGIAQNGATQPRNAVVAFDVDTHQLKQRYDVPGARQLNDVAIAPGGRAFVTDSESGAVYELPVKVPASAREVVPPGGLRGSNGIAVSPDAKRLYVAHATGIAVVELTDGTLARVENRTRENIAAIDGLYMWHGQLIGVENVTNPGRVVLITLSREGDTITKVQTLLSHHHNVLDEPTTG